MAESTLTPTFDGIANEVAIYLGLPRTRALRDTTEDEDVDQCVYDGHMQFLTPPWTDAGLPSHQWAFLRLDTTVTMTADTETTDCPDDFGCLLTGTLFYTDSDTAPFHHIDVRGADSVRSEYQEDDDYSEDPYMATIRPKAFTAATGQRYEIRWYPVSDTAHVVTFPYLAVPDKGSSSNYMQGGMVHSQTLIASCRAMAERKFNDTVGNEWANFMSKLRASYAIDVLNSPRNYGPYGDFDTSRRPPESHLGVTHGNSGLTYTP